jgi:AcrR family transcriptional regulator
MAIPTTRSTKRRGERRPLPESKSARTRRRILDACAAALRRDGYAAVTLKDVAALAGLQAGSLYYHFRSKEEIVEEVLGLGVDVEPAVDAVFVHRRGPIDHRWLARVSPSRMDSNAA